MKHKKSKRMLVPIGLLFVTGISFIEHFVKLEISDLTLGFLQGLGIGIMLTGIFYIQRCRKMETKINVL